MFKFEPSVSLEIIEKHVAEVKAARITLRTGEEISQALIQEFAQPGSTNYASTYSIQNKLDEEADKLWSRFKYSITSALKFLAYDGIETSANSFLTEILNYRYRFPAFRDNLEKALAIYKELSCESEIYNQLYKMLQHVAEIAPLYTWAHCNSTDTSTNVSIGNLTFPQNGRLYSYCFALLPETERALALTQWALATKNADSMEVVAKHMAYHLNAFLIPDEGKSIQPITVSEHK